MMNDQDVRQILAYLDDINRRLRQLEHDVRQIKRTTETIKSRQ
jgi:hypothetical protein